MEKISRQQLIDKITELRGAIRWHRDQKGDNRCWLNDFRVWSCLYEPTVYAPDRLPHRHEMMVKCGLFFAYRGTETADPVPADATHDRALWDQDLEKMEVQQLEQTLEKLLAAIEKHLLVEEEKNRPRTVDDDRELYSVLPERLPADFTLPPRAEFLGTAKPDAGCPAFLASHQQCPGGCNLKRWGPCGSKK